MKQYHSQISIIAPVYNTSVYLDRCVNSVLSQTYSNWTLLLIDDGSTDNSGKLCDAFAELDSRIRVFHKSNGGVCSARNLGLDLIETPYLTFIDTDDYIGPRFLEDLMEGGDADVSVTGYVLHRGEDVEDLSPVVVSTLPDLIGTLGVRQELGWLCRLRLKTSIIREYKIRFKEKYKVLEDECFASEYLNYSDSVFVKHSSNYHYLIPDPTAKYERKWNDDVYFDIASFVFRKLDKYDADECECVSDIRATKKYYLVAMYRSFEREQKKGDFEKARFYASQLKRYIKYWRIYPRVLLFTRFTAPIVDIYLRFRKA